MSPAVTTPVINPQLEEFKSGLASVEKLGRVKRDNVWEVIELYPTIVKPVAQIVSSLPSTQVSVERLFSQLRLVLRENRANMSADLVDAILFLKMNKLV